MPVQGFVRLRKHQFGRQSDIDTAVAATRAYPFSGTPSVNLNWTDPDVDTGAIITTVTPQRGPSDLTAALTDPQLCYNNIPLLMAALFGGGASPTGGGTGKTWTHKPAAVAPIDDEDYFAYEFGDDVVTDWYQLLGGILESLTVTGPEGLGAVTTSMTWRFASAASTGSTDSPVSGTVPTPDLDVATDDAVVYLKDMGIYIADNVAGLAAGQVLDALHTFTLTITKTTDQKRWANQDQSFDADAIVRTGFEVSLACTFSKTADTVGTGSESDDWFSDDAVNRVIRLKFLSTKIAQTSGSVPYSWQVTMPMRYYTREEGESGGNSVIVLTANAFYEPSDFAGFFESILVGTLTEAELGTVGS